MRAKTSDECEKRKLNKSSKVFVEDIMNEISLNNNMMNSVKKYQCITRNNCPSDVLNQVTWGL